MTSPMHRLDVHILPADKVIMFTLVDDDIFITCGDPDADHDALNRKTVHVPVDGPLRDLVDVLLPLVKEVRLRLDVSAALGSPIVADGPVN